jgi:hypothetical protein
MKLPAFSPIAVHFRHLQDILREELVDGATAISLFFPPCSSDRGGGVHVAAGGT